jgi:hypothetical protein
MSIHNFAGRVALVTGAGREHIDLSQFDPRLVTPVAPYLAHEECRVTGEVLSAGAGRWARIFTGKTVGHAVVSDDIDDVFALLQDVMDERDYAILTSTQAQYD